MDINQAWDKRLQDFTKEEGPTEIANEACHELLVEISKRNDIEAISNVRVYKKGYVVSWGGDIISQIRYLEITVKNDGSVFPTANKSIKGITASLDWIKDKLNTPAYLDMGPGGLIDAYIISCGPKLSDIIGVYSKQAAMYLISELKKKPHDSKYKAEDYKLLFISSNGLDREEL